MMNDTYLYPYSSAEARERDELPLWRESHKANIACRNAIEDAELTPADFVGVTGTLGRLVDRSVFGGLGLARRFAGSPVAGEPS